MTRQEEGMAATAIATPVSVASTKGNFAIM
jgi:hypothetical protein